MWESHAVPASMKKRFYTFLMKAGHAAGCHQMPDRSFFFKEGEYQFPVCARCTGVVIGQIMGALSFWWLSLSHNTISFLCFLMFFDWWLQRVGLLHSTNLRRLVTGIFCGFALGNAYVQFVFWLGNGLSVFMVRWE